MRVVEGVDLFAVRGGERDVDLPCRSVRRHRPEPERGTVHPVADDGADLGGELHQSLAAQRGEHGVVEGGAGRDVGDLEREMINHAASIATGSDSFGAAAGGSTPR